MTTAVAEDRWISVETAARILGRSKMQVHRYIGEGKIRARRFGTRGWKTVSSADVKELAKSTAQS